MSLDSYAEKYFTKILNLHTFFKWAYYNFPFMLTNCSDRIRCQVCIEWNVLKWDTVLRNILNQTMNTPWSPKSYLLQWRSSQVGTLVMNWMLCTTVFISETLNVKIMLNMWINIENGVCAKSIIEFGLWHRDVTCIKFGKPQYTDNDKNIHKQKGNCTITT